MHALPELDACEDALDGLLATARNAWSVNHIQRALEAARWTEAMHAIEQLAARFRDHDVAPDAWRQLLRAALWLAPRRGTWRRSLELMELDSLRAWRDDDLTSMPWIVAESLSSLSRRRPSDGARADALQLARLLDARFPRCPLGAYSLGHFGRDPAEAARCFRRAAAGFELLDLSQLAAHAQLRASTLIHLRELPGAARHPRLSELWARLTTPQERSWWSIGMAKSPRWLDRVRGADALVDRIEARRDDDEEAREELRETIRWVVTHAPADLEAIEHDRLAWLVEEGIPADEQAPLYAHLQQLAHAKDNLSRPLSALPDLLAPPEASTASARDLYYDALAALERHQPPTTQPFRDALPVAAGVVDTLAAVRAQQLAAVATHLGLLERVLREDNPAGPHLRPLSVLWPELLGLVFATRQDEAPDPTTRSRIIASIEAIGARAIPRAPTPRYGWWALAANFLKSGFVVAGRLATRRALESKEPAADTLAGQVLNRVIGDLVSGASIDHDTLAWWMQRAAARLKPSSRHPR